LNRRSRDQEFLSSRKNTPDLVISCEALGRD
jgi:hypothetical protein